jgi:hypothetical protein
MKMMSNYWTVFGVVSTLILYLVLKVSIVSVSGISTPHNSADDIPILSALSGLCIISQLVIMNFVRTRNSMEKLYREGRIVQNELGITPREVRYLSRSQNLGQSTP